MARSGLTLRLLVLLAGSILPAMAALVYMQLGLRHDRAERVGETARHQSQLLAAEVETLIDSGRQMMLAVAADPATRALQPGCATQLATLHRDLPAYALIAVVDASGKAVCSVGDVPIAVLQSQIHDAKNAARFAVGHFTPLGAGRAVLPIVLPFQAVGQQAAIVVAIDVAALGRTVQQFRTSRFNSVTIADRDGIILDRLPDTGHWMGHAVAPDARDLVRAPQGGIRRITGLDGLQRIVGFVPSTQADGLYVAYGLYVPEMMAPIDAAARRSYALIALGAAIALLLMMLATRRMVDRPTKALLKAAQDWTDGKLAVRAQLRVRPGTEFARLAAAFNQMAEALELRRAQSDQLNTTLEARVAERTLALSQTNNRLLVEMAERERTDAALRQFQKLQAVGHLAGGMAHEFNNLLATIMGALDLLRLRLGEGHPLQRYTSPAIDAAHRGARLTSQMLAFARRRRLLPVAVALDAVISDMRELIAGTLGREIALTVQADPDLWLALADRHEIEAAVLNLVLNARDAMRQGGMLSLSLRNIVIDDDAGLDACPGLGLEPDADPTRAATHAGQFVELVVADDGEGMTEDELDRAVDPFFTTKGPGRGAGLGLSQVHGIAQQLGGDLRIVSRRGVGTTVRLLLPRALPSEPPAAMPGCDPACRRKVLLVDDDPQVRAVSADMLTEIGYQVATAASGEEAAELLSARDYAVLVADYAMPGMTGIELIRRCRRSHPGMLPLLITGYMDLDSGVVADVLGPRHVLRKPFTINELADRITELLRVTV